MEDISSEKIGNGLYYDLPLHFEVTERDTCVLPIAGRAAIINQSDFLPAGINPIQGGESWMELQSTPLFLRLSSSNSIIASRMMDFMSE